MDARLAQYYSPSFIDRDPICVAHSFTRLQDIEIAGFFAAILAWGQRTTIINNSRRLMQLMDNSPYDFIRNHAETDLIPFLGFVHRTFNATDLLFLIGFLQRHYAAHISLETAFFPEGNYTAQDTEQALIHFHHYCFRGEFPERTRKHIPTPLRNSACKRLNMYLRWMARKDDKQVDFGLWKTITPAQLVCPLDTHVASVAYRLGILDDEQSNWHNAIALTNRLRELNAADPVLYDFALFSLGRHERF